MTANEFKNKNCYKRCISALILVQLVRTPINRDVLRPTTLIHVSEDQIF